MLAIIVRYITMLIVALCPAIGNSLGIDPLLPDYRIIIDTSTDVETDILDDIWKILPYKLPAGSVAGVITYSDLHSTFIDTSVVNSNWREEAALQKLPQLSELRVNLTDSIRYTARYWVEKDRSYNRNIVLFTSGRLTSSKSSDVKREIRADLMETVVPLLKERGVILNIIQIGNNTDSDVLSKAARSTGGQFFQATGGRQVLASLNNIFNDTSSSNGSSGLGNNYDNNYFTVEHGVGNMTLVAKKGTATSLLKLQSPSGKVYQADQRDREIRWFQSGLLDYITVARPKSGKWTIIGNLSGSKPFNLYKNINIKMKNDLTKYYLGEIIPIKISVFSDEGIVKDNLLFDTISMDLFLYEDEELIESYDLTDNIVRDNNNVVQGYYNLNIDTSRLTNMKSSKDIHIKLNGRTIKSEIKSKLEISESPFVIEQETQIGSGNAKKIIFNIKMLSDIIDSDSIDSDSIDLNVQVKDESGLDFPANVSLIRDNSWMFYLLPSKKTNSYFIKIRAKALTIDGRGIDMYVANLSVAVPDIELPDPEIIYKEILVNNSNPEVITVETEKEISGENFIVGLILVILVNIFIPAIWFGGVYLLRKIDDKEQIILTEKFANNIGTEK